VGIHPYVILAMKPGVLNEDASTGPKIQIAVGGEETTVEEIEGLKDDEGADKSGSGGVVVRGKDSRQASRETILNDTERKVRIRANAYRLTTRDEVRDAEVFGKLPILRDNTDVVDGGEPERLNSREQWGMVDKDRDRGDFNRKPGSGFVPGAIFGATEGVDADVLVGVLVVLIDARGVWEDDGGRNVLLVVKVWERWQGTG
jgi:hypothetical protein